MKMSLLQIQVGMTPEELAAKVQSGEWTVNTNWDTATLGASCF